MTDGLLDLPLPDLMARARQIRDEAHGTRVTFSPKVFIPLTMLCRDKCGYCTFAQPPARLEAPYLSPEQVLRIARPGCRGRLPRGPVHPGRARPRSATRSPREWLAEHGYASTVDYLVAMCRAGARRDRAAPPRQRRRARPPTSWRALRAVSRVARG